MINELMNELQDVPVNLGPVLRMEGPWEMVVKLKCQATLELPEVLVQVRRAEEFFALVEGTEAEHQKIGNWLNRALRGVECEFLVPIEDIGETAGDVLLRIM